MIGHHGMTVLTFITLALPAGRKRTGLLPCFRACLLNGSPLTLDAIKTARFILTLHRWLVPGLALGLAWLCHSAAQEPNAGNVGPEPAVSLVPLAEHGPDPNRWALVGLNTAAAVCFVIWWRWMGRRKGHAAFARTGRSALVRFEPGADDEWKARALAAEARAEKAAALLRSKLMPQVARWMMGELVQRLLSHRSELVASQQQAEAEVSDLEKRLEKIHAPLAERLEAYEKRIGELERELAAKGEENRELIKARIASARKKLESERAKDPLNWN